MKRITLYHRGIPVTYHRLDKDSFSIGSHPSNDLVLADSGVARRHLVIFRGQGSGSWLARPADETIDIAETEIHPGTRIALGQYVVEIESFGADGARTPESQSDSSVLASPPDLGLVGTSLQIRLLRAEITQLSPLRAPVLVSGETGTGKELVAVGLHKNSDRARGPFVPVNCGGISETLLEDVLFGHERGAFTGANDARRGVFEQASGGTLFLDEIGELPIAQQAALLRVLDDKKVRRMGAECLHKADFRLVTATNRDLQKLIKKGQFRHDLYHRIAALTINTASLRDRPEDVKSLSEHFLLQMADEMGERILDAEALVLLERHHWPGNARELRNVLYRAAATTSCSTLSAGDFDVKILCKAPKRGAFRLDHVPTSKLHALLDKHRGNVAAAARELGVPRTSLRDRLKRHQNPLSVPAPDPTAPVSMAS